VTLKIFTQNIQRIEKICCNFPWT